MQMGHCSVQCSDPAEKGYRHLEDQVIFLLPCVLIGG